MNQKIIGFIYKFESLFGVQVCVGNEYFIVHFFYEEYTILKEHDFKNRKNNKGMDRLQQAYECGLLYTCF